MYEVHPWSSHWETIIWHMAHTYGFWLTVPTESPPTIIQINCGGLGGGNLCGRDAPTIHCTHPRVNGACVYGPSLAPADRYSGQVTGVAADLERIGNRTIAAKLLPAWPLGKALWVEPKWHAIAVAGRIEMRCYQ